MIDSLIDWLVAVLTGFRDSGPLGQLQFIIAVFAPLAGAFLLAWAWGRWRFRERLRNEEQRDARLATLAEEVKTLKADLKAERAEHDATGLKLAELEAATTGFLGELDAELNDGNHTRAVALAQAYIDRQATGLTRAAELLAEHWVGLAAEDGPSAYAEAESFARLGLGVSPGYPPLRQLAAQLAEAQAVEAAGVHARVRSAGDRAAALVQHRSLQGNFASRVEALIALGDTHMEKGRYALAHGLFDAAARLAEVATNPRDPLALAARLLCLQALNKNHDFTRGLRLADRLIPWLTEMDGPEGAATLSARFFKARLLNARGESTEAEAAFRDLLPIGERVEGPEHPDTLSIRHELTSTLLAQGKAAEAGAALRDLLPLHERIKGPEHPDTIATRHGLASAFLIQGKAAEAEAAFRDLQPLQERVRGPEHPDTLVTWQQIANALLDQGKAAEAEAALRDLLPLREQVLGPEHPGTLATRRLLARATLEQGAMEQAREQLSALPEGGDQPPDAKAREAMLRGWLADLDGERPAADTLLDQADALLSHLDPAHYLRVQLARYRETRGPDGKGGTTIAAEYTRPS